MPALMTSLWPDDIKFDAQSPLSILQTQAELLSKITRNILQGTVETETSDSKVQHRLVIVAPTYNGYRHTLITAIQGSKLPFPVEVRAEALGREEKRERDATIVDQMVGGIMGNKRTYSVIVFPTANDDSEMITLIQKALRSGSTRAIITSLIAKSNEANGRPSPDSTENGHAGHESTPDASDDGLDSDE